MNYFLLADISLTSVLAMGGWVLCVLFPWIPIFILSKQVAILKARASVLAAYSIVLQRILTEHQITDHDEIKEYYLEAQKYVTEHDL